MGDILTIDEKELKIPFTPVQGTEVKILSSNNGEALEGHIYFSTDTKKIFLGKDKKFIPICEKNTFFYGNKDVGWDDSGIDPLEEQQFSFEEDIEGEDFPEINDLILNEDGCFYRVKNISDDTITAIRLTLQGSGGNNSSGPSAGGSMSIQIIGSSNKFFSTQATTMPITFQGNYNGSDDNYITRVVFKIGGSSVEKGEIFYEHEEIIQFSVEKTIDLIEYKHLFNTSVSKTVWVQIVDKYGVTRSEDVSIKLVELKLNQTVKNLFAVYENEFQYDTFLTGATSGITDKKIIFNFQKENDLSQNIESQERNLAVTDTGALYKTLNFSNFDHGIYTLKVKAYARITGTSTTIESNELKHKFCVFKKENATPLLLIMIPEIIEQYENIQLDYLFATDEEISKEYTLKILINNEEAASLACESNKPLNSADYEPYYLYFENQESYSLSCQILETGATYEEFIKVVPYTGYLPIIDADSPELMLYLNPRGKSNNEVDRNKWKDSRKESIYTANLTGLQYGTINGWLKDSNKVSYLKLSQGAELSLKEFKPFQEDLSLGKGFTVELDFEINGILDYSKPLISCLSQTITEAYGPGFVITGNKAKFYSSNLNDNENIGTLINLGIMEGKRTKIAFVVEPNSMEEKFPMCRTYLNGILSQTAIYDKGDSFGGEYAYPASLKIDSTYGEIKIYSIRFYRVAKDSASVLRNYIASLDTINDRKEKYALNDVDDGNDNIDFLRVSSEDYNLQIPYMKITGGYPTKELSKWELEDDFSEDGPRLPTGKKDYRLIDVEIVYPKTELFSETLGYKTFKFKNQFASGEMKDNAGNKPINGGCIMYGQGTSSMEYPVKNLRLRLKNDKFMVKPDIDSVEIICMKADYMESSGSHNTGAGNLIDKIYENAKIKTPGQEKFGPSEEDIDKKKIVTCIKGYPCLIFYSETGDENSYKYIGKYNLNLDKATPEPFGFLHDKEDGFGYLTSEEPDETVKGLENGNQYYSIQYYYDKDEPAKGTFIGQENPSEGGDYNKNYEETLLTVTEDSKINSIHCFEFLDNAVEVCNFMGKKKLSKVNNITEEEFNENKSKEYYILIDDKTQEYKLADSIFDSSQTYYKNQPYSYWDTWYGTFKNSKNKDVPGWTLGFESRYPEDRTGYHDADALWPLASWLNELYLKRISEEVNDGLTPDDIEYINTYERAYDYTPGRSYYIKDATHEYIEAFPSSTEDLQSGEYYIIVSSNKRFNMDSLERFKREYQCYFDKDFLLAYYLITEALLMADSRVKNMMIATWKKERRTYTTLEGEERQTYYHIFYPIFYDMDTMLGLDNTGYDRFSYYSEDTDSSIYNGDEVLWNFVRDALGDELADFYNNKLDSTLSANTVLSYFNNNQANLPNEIFYNEDAEYKYIEPAIEGYLDYSKDPPQPIAPGKAPYLYALQGDRSLAREYFITNRLKYLQGKYKTNIFQNNDKIDFRWYYPTTADSNELIAKSAQFVPPTSSFTFKSLREGFSGVKLGANGMVYTKKTAPNQEITINLPEASGANGTEAYILGVSNLTSLGDLSNKYLQKFSMAGVSDIRLKELILGNPHQFYYNNKWQADGQSPIPISLEGCSYLEYFNLQNCLYSGGLDFSNCPVIQKILLTGSNVTSLTLPVSGALTKLKLPKSVTKLKIDSHKNLTDFSIGNYSYGSKHQIEAEDEGFYTNDYKYITELNIIDTPINTYDIVKGAVSLTKYNLQNIEWEILDNDNFYCQKGLGMDLEKDPDTIYYIYDASNTKGYIVADENNPEHLKKIWFEKISTVDNNGNINHIAVLEYLQTLSTIGNNTPHAISLSGTIKINIEGSKADELFLYNKYISIYPQLKITYGSKVDLTEAVSVNMYRKPIILLDENDEVSFEFGDEEFNKLEPYYNKLLNGADQNLGNVLTDSNYIAPTLSAEEKKEYEFTGRWIDYNTEVIYIQDNYKSYQKAGDKLFSEQIPTDDLYLFPIFIEKDRIFSVEFYDWNGELIQTFTKQYGDTLAGAEPTDETVFLWYMYRDDSELGEDVRWALKGWKSQSDYINETINPDLITNFANTFITRDLKLYAHYIQENVYNEVSCFNSKDGDDYFIIASEKELDNNYAISIKEIYRNRLQGKITLPIQYKNKDIIAVKDCARMFNVSEIYFVNAEKSGYKYLGLPSITSSVQQGVLTGFNCEIISNESSETNLKEKRKLRKIVLPDSITHIGYKCFTDNFILQTINLPTSLKVIGYRAFGRADNIASISSQYTLNVEIPYLPSSVDSIGDYAFYQAGPNVTISQIPPKVTQLGSFTFAGCPNLKIENFGAWDGYDSELKTIGPACFRKSGKAVNKIYLGDSLTSIVLGPDGMNPSFEGYGNDTGGEYYNNSILQNIDSNSLGLPDGWTLAGQSSN